MLTDRCWPVQAEIRMRLVESAPIDETGPVWTCWPYATVDPYAVHVDFGDGNVWEISRELVARGLRAPTGLGDVQVWPGRGRVSLALESPDGRAVLSARHRDVAGFLATTYCWVPRGEEPVYLDWDAVIARIREEADQC